MGGELFESDPVFRQQMNEMDEVVRAETGCSVVQEIYGSRPGLMDPIFSLAVSHPAIFMTEYALVRVLEREGICPDGVLGFSLGEFAAAVTAGVLSAGDALTLITRQAKLIADNCREGGMLAILAGSEIYHSIPELAKNTSIAAVHTSELFVISGEREGIMLAQKGLRERGIVYQDLMVPYGFHSPNIDPAGNAYRSFLKELAFRPPGLPVFSGMRGEVLSSLPEGYLWDVVRQPMSFKRAMDAVEMEFGHGEKPVYIDLGVSGSLANLVKKVSGRRSGAIAFQIMTPFRQEASKMERLKEYFSTNKRILKAHNPAGDKDQPLLACIFPGQGSQKVGMGGELFSMYPRLTEAASEILGYSVRDLCVKDPNRQLNKTEYTQPALFVVNALSYLKLKEETGLIPDLLAGHSLGEYNALYASGVLDFETGLRLVQKRGALSAKARDGGMAAVKGLSAETIRQVIERHGLAGIEIANYNMHDQIVLAGPRDLINGSGVHFDAAGATLYFPLNVSAAFHSSYMLPFKEELQEALQQVNFSSLKIPVVSNVEANLYSYERIRHLLTWQFVKPVRWFESMVFIMERGLVTFKEVGPGEVLTKMAGSIGQWWNNSRMEAVSASL